MSIASALAPGLATAIWSSALVVVGVLLVAFIVGRALRRYRDIDVFWPLGFVAVAFMYAFMPHASLDTVAQNVYEEMSSITLLSIPLFILKGAAIGRSRAGADLYSALHAWMYRIPGGLGSWRNGVHNNRCSSCIRSCRL